MTLDYNITVLNAQALIPGSTSKTMTDSKSIIDLTVSSPDAWGELVDDDAGEATEEEDTGVMTHEEAMALAALMGNSFNLDS